MEAFFICKVFFIMCSDCDNYQTYELNKTCIKWRCIDVNYLNGYLTDCTSMGLFA